MSVLIVGSIAYDGIKTPAGEVDMALGGSATYSSLSASYYSPVKVVGVVGKDFAEKDLNLLKDKSIDIEGVHINKEKDTFYWKGYYEQDMGEAITISTHLNAFEDFNPVIPQSYKDAKYVFLANIDPDLQLNVLDQVEEPKLVLCDTMNFWINTKRDQLLEVFKRVDIILVNEGEAKQLCGTTNIQTAAKELLSLGAMRVIIKKGGHGCLMFGKDSYFAAPAFPLETLVDTTGAGDTFAGGFTGYMSKVDEISEENFRKAVVFGTTMASFTVQDFSVNKLLDLKKEDILKRYNTIKEITSFGDGGL